MASILNVDQIRNAAGTNALTIDSSGNVNIPGHVVQVVRGVVPTSNESFTSTSYTASSLYVTITPKFSTSEVFITANLNMDYATGTNASLAIYKDGSLLTPHGSGTYDGHSYYNRLSNSRILSQQPIMAYDTSVGTTSAVTYKVYVKTHSGSVDIRHDLAVGAIVAMEIAG